MSFIARSGVPRSGLARASSHLARCCLVAARSGSTCSVDGHHIDLRGLGTRIARLDLVSPCLGGLVIARPWRPCEGYHSRWLTDQSATVVQAQGLVEDHSRSQSDAM